ncbi:hypothetical protein C0Z16_15915 [Paraburkholderia rhynchosiae]|nr:hypothetical protein C0Z16_15915 [Paraburkholderia rhynchosiae]
MAALALPAQTHGVQATLSPQQAINGFISKHIARLVIDISAGRRAGTRFASPEYLPHIRKRNAMNHGHD